MSLIGRDWRAVLDRAAALLIASNEARTASRSAEDTPDPSLPNSEEEIDTSE